MEPALDAFPFLPFLAFAVSASATPGPNNVLLLASGAARGMLRTLPLLFGIQLGFAIMVASVSFGLARPLASHPGLHAVLRVAGTAWLLLLAWKIARATPALDRAADADRMPGFLAGAALQWVNPKAWVIALATAATYASASAPWLPALLLALVGVPMCGLWAAAGHGLGHLLSSPARLRRFNLAMGILLAASVVPVLLER